MSYPFPDDVRNPDRKEPNPFAEDHVDDVTDVTDVTEDGGLQASQVATEYKPEYVTSQSNRSTLVLVLGVLGLVLSLSSWTAYTGNTYLILMPLISLAFSVTAVALGYSDASAIRLGAKSDRNSHWLMIGAICGLLGIVNSAAFIIVGIVITDLLVF